MTEVPTYTATIFIGGDPIIAENLCAGFCMARGLCVTVEPISFIYKGGRELGVRVGLINYPRFPADPADIFDTALELARQLRAVLNQWSFSIVATDKTVFETVRPA